MTLNGKKVEGLPGGDGTDTSPFINALELAALLESRGFGDGAATKEGFTNIFSLAEHLFSRFQPSPRLGHKASDTREQLGAWAESRCAMRKFSLSLTYAIPWMTLLIIEYLRPNAFKVQPELGGALSLALIASLITTGGFIQMISRSGSLYYGLQEPFLARHTCMAILNVGLTSSLLLGLLGMIVGAYFRTFAGYYLMLAAINFVALSLLWLLCSMLSVTGIGWCVPPVFFLSGFICGVIKLLGGVGNTILLTLWPVTAVLCALSCVLVGFHRAEEKFPSARESARPRPGVLAIALAPYSLYGTLYFSFLFADRLAAGSAVSWVSGLSFGINPAYKSGMDLVLLVFLITAALVEYLSDSFMRFWRRLAAELPQADGQRLVTSLRWRHRQTITLISVLFILCSVVSWVALSRLSGLTHSPLLLQTAVLGGVGYLMLSIALFEIVILASLNATSQTLAALAVGLGVNLMIGYGLSHFFGVQYAAAGLLAGSAVLMWKCNAKVREVFRHPDYHYSIS